jgi:hypothetical protein
MSRRQAVQAEIEKLELELVNKRSRLEQLRREQIQPRYAQVRHFEPGRNPGRTIFDVEDDTVHGLHIGDFVMVDYVHFPSRTAAVVVGIQNGRTQTYPGRLSVITDEERLP